MTVEIDAYPDTDLGTLDKRVTKVFNANKKPSSCGSCVQQTLAKLKKVYINNSFQKICQNGLLISKKQMNQIPKQET